MLTIRKFIFYLLVLLVLFLVVPIKESQPVIEFEQGVKDKVMEVTDNGSVTDKALQLPDKQAFSINNIQMNMTKKEVEDKLGEAQRVTSNEYGTKWYAYHSDEYKQFVMVSYIDNKVNALYTNQNIITSKSKIKYGTPKSVVRSRLGDPIDRIKKGNANYLQDNDEYDTFLKDHIYTTVFYDEHNDNNLTSLLQISEEMEDRLQQQYGAPSQSLAQSFELQNFDLVNAERVQHGLNTLSYSEGISNTARKHSKDMAEHHYFDHENQSGKSPFDRLEDDGWHFNAAGENLAYGQMSSIYAHEGLMNSLGHRKNILKRQFSTLGVGVDFNDKRQPYWTENYTG